MKNFLLACLILISFNSFSESAPEEVIPLDPAYEGIHGMVLMKKYSKIFAYHMPLFRKPHDVQLLYKLSVSDVALLHLVRDNDMVTIKPKPFNLERLIRGEKFVVEADVYIGHFERDGILVYKDKTISFSKQLYMRKLDEIEPSSNKQVYDTVSYDKNYKIFIHRLQQPPTYDHLIHIDVNASCLTTFNTSSPVPERNELQYKFLNCGTMLPFYYETEDFEKPSH